MCGAVLCNEAPFPLPCSFGAVYLLCDFWLKPQALNPRSRQVNSVNRKYSRNPTTCPALVVQLPPWFVQHTSNYTQYFSISSASSATSDNQAFLQVSLRPESRAGRFFQRCPAIGACLRTFSLEHASAALCMLGAPPPPYTQQATAALSKHREAQCRWEPSQGSRVPLLV